MGNVGYSVFEVWPRRSGWSDYFKNSTFKSLLNIWKKNVTHTDSLTQIPELHLVITHSDDTHWFDCHFVTPSLTLQLLPLWSIGAISDLILTRWWWVTWLDLTENLKTLCHGDLSNTMEPHICFFHLNGTIIYIMNIMSYQRLQTNNWDHKLIGKLFAGVINQVTNGAIFP